MCDSIDCPMTYARVQATRDVEDLKGVQEVLASVVHEGGAGTGGGSGDKRPFWEAMEW
jgi:hypothetical protein